MPIVIIVNQFLGILDFFVHGTEQKHRVYVLPIFFGYPDIRNDHVCDAGEEFGHLGLTR